MWTLVSLKHNYTTTAKSAALWVQMISVVEFTHGGLKTHIFDMISCNWTWEDGFLTKTLPERIVLPILSVHMCFNAPVL